MARPVICLDTNYLILGLVPGSREGELLRAWTVDAVALIAPTLVWYEFLCGPVDARHVDIMRAFLHEIVPLSETHARVAAELYHGAGRRRSTRVDAMIAATAIAANAAIATNNMADFELFQAAGLRFA